MKTLFENKYVRSANDFKEYYFYFHFKRPSPLIANAIFFISFIVGLLSLFFPEIVTLHYFTKAAYVTIAPLILAVTFFRYKKEVKLAYARDLEFNGDKPIESTLLITEENGEYFCEGTATKTAIKFSHIKKAVKTRNLVLLTTKAEMAFIFRKDSFTQGTYDEFLLFLKDKGFKV